MDFDTMMIRVCDDEQESRDQWVADIKSALGNDHRHFVEPFDNRAVGELLERQTSYRLNQPRNEEECAFDTADVLVVDYDLVFIDPKKAHHTGEEIARLARIYSRCGYIIVLNQGNRTADFDLTMRGRHRSYADLNIPAKTIKHPALWGPAEPGDFAPWVWDDIPAILKGRLTLVAELGLEGRIESSVVGLLGMPDEALAELSDEAFAFVNPTAETQQELRDTTISQFLGFTTERKDVDTILRDRPERAIGLAIARLGKWLSRLVLGPQEILIDVPHLLQRYPFVLDPAFGDVNDPRTWNAAVLEGAASIAEPFRTECAFIRSRDWIAKDSFWWPTLERHPAANKLRAGFDFDRVPDIVFAEDISMFIPQGDATTFRAAFHNRFDRRFIAKLDHAEYGPSRRLAFS